MTTANPLLRDDEFVAYSDIRPEHVMPAVEARIADCRARIEALVADPAQHRFDTLMLAWEDCEDALNRCFAPVGHLHNVRDTPEWREAYGEAIELLTDFGTEIGQHAGLCAAVRSIRARADFDALPAAARKLVEDALLDFRLAGVDLPPDKQQRYRAIATELSRLSTEFEQAVLDATEAWTLDLTEGDARLAGLPESALALLKQAAQDAKADGLRITLQPPVYQALMMHAVARIALHGRIDSIQCSWVKLGVDGAAAALGAGCNDLGGVLMNESISRAAGAAHGQEVGIDELFKAAASAGRPLRQRTTLYKQVVSAREDEVA